jgi:hypothetical protein
VTVSVKIKVLRPNEKDGSYLRGRGERRKVRIEVKQEVKTENFHFVS